MTFWEDSGLRRGQIREVWLYQISIIIPVMMQPSIVPATNVSGKKMNETIVTNQIVASSLVMNVEVH